MATHSYESRILAQSRPPTSTSIGAYTESKGGYIETIIVANTSASTAAYSIFIDPTGAGVRDETTAIAFAITIPANSTEIIVLDNPIPIPQGTDVGVKSGTGDALTFHFFGSTKVQ